MRKHVLTFALFLTSLFMCSCGGDPFFEEYDIYGDYNPDAIGQSQVTSSYLTRYENTSCISIPVPDDRYRYPVVPGTPEWQDAMSEMGSNGLVKYLRIPAEKLSEMSTGAVVWAYFDYPFISDWILSNYPRKRAQSYLETTPAGPEMMKRKDLAEYLYNYYLLYDPIGCSLHGGALISENLELVLSFPEVSAKFSVKQARVLVNTALENIELRKANNLGPENERTCLMIAHLMFAAGYDSFRTAAIRDGDIYKWMFDLEEPFPYLEDYSVIIRYAQMFAKQ